MARTKTTSPLSEDDSTPIAHSQPPPQTAADESNSSALNENPIHTVLRDEIIPITKTSKPKIKKETIKPQETRKSSRIMSGTSSSKTNTVSHVDLTDSVEKDDSEETLYEFMKVSKAESKKKEKGKTQVIETPPASETFEKDSRFSEEEEETTPPKKHGKGKDVKLIASLMKAEKEAKQAQRPVSKAKYFDFADLKKKNWNLREYTDSQEWTNFVSLQDLTFENLVREFYGSMRIKEKDEKILTTIVKGVKIKITNEFLSKALRIPNEGNELFFPSWFAKMKVSRNKLIVEYTQPDHPFNSTNLKDVPKILQNMIRHTLLPKSGTFDAVSDTYLCIMYLITKKKLNLCYIILQHMINSCMNLKQSNAALAYGMHITPILIAAKVNLEEEEEDGDYTFMRFTSKTLAQLHITTSNMPTLMSSEATGSVKRHSDQNVKKSRKKRKLEKVRNLSSIQRQEDNTHEKEAADEDMADSPPKKDEPAAVDLFQGIAERAIEILQENVEVRNVDDS